jgi:hypothetical protein
VVNSIPSIYFNGIGPLANKEYNGNSLTIRTMLEIKDRLALQANQIYSNEHKVLSLFCDYQKISQLPKSKDFAGNSYIENKERFIYESRTILETMTKTTQWLLVYIKLNEDHPRYDRQLDSFITNHITNQYNFNIESSTNSVLIWPKQ